VEIASGVTLVDFWATWCGPCRTMLPIMEQISKEIGDDAKVIKVNVEDHPDIAGQYSIRNLPAFLLMKNGDVMEEFSGRQDKATLLNAIRSL